MKTEQKIIRIRNAYTDTINGYLRDGWKVVNMSTPVVYAGDVTMYVVIEKRTH